MRYSIQDSLQYHGHTKSRSLIFHKIIALTWQLIQASRNLLGTSAQPLKTTCNLLIIWLRGSFKQVAWSLLVGIQATVKKEEEVVIIFRRKSRSRFFVFVFMGVWCVLVGPCRQYKNYRLIVIFTLNPTGCSNFCSYCDILCIIQNEDTENQLLHKNFCFLLFNITAYSNEIQKKGFFPVGKLIIIVVI